MIINPTTTPGKASGKVSIATSKAWPGNRRRCRNNPLMVAITKVAIVVAAASDMVLNKVAWLEHNGRVSAQTVLPARAGKYQACHRQQKKRRDQNGQRHKAKTDECPLAHARLRSA